ncbi:MAG: hypothetical protein NXI02_30535 [Rhodobacteraceae bacterium]|nr:hypothetical protein [Paracoccaceae bacterium]
MKKFDGYATLLFGVLIGLALGLVVGMWSPPSIFEVPEACQGQEFWCWLNNWQTLFTGGIAFLAALIAWKGIQDQIKIGRINETQSKSLLDQELNDFLQEVNQVWRILEVSLDEKFDESQKSNALNIARANAKSSFWSSKILDHAELLAGLLPADKNAYEKVFVSLRRIKAELDRKKTDDDFNEGPGLRAQSFAIQLSHLVKYLEQANGTLADVFRERKKCNVDHTPSWHSSKEEADRNLEKWEEELSKPQVQK